MRILVAGGYGLIGRHVTARLLREGHAVTGVGRDTAAAARWASQVDWVRLDLADTSSEAWAARLADVDAVVNCAGALQDSPRDDLEAVHITGPLMLANACVAAGVRRFVQVSAAGVEQGPGAFRGTKRAADLAIQELDLDWVILRPGLVLAPTAYGGSALLRGLAAFPGLIPAIHADAVVQVVSVEAVADAVARAVRPDGPAKVVCDLVAAEPTQLRDLLVALRGWLGLPPARVVPVPPLLGRVSAAMADGLAWLGWRSPMRSTAIAQLAAGVRGEGTDAARVFGFTPQALDEILAGWPAGVQERWFARLYFLKPLALATLALFWTLSGVIGLVGQEAAAKVLTDVGFGEAVARACVIGGAVVDIALGLLVCVRRTAPAALLGMVIVTGGYLIGATLWRPDLWADPLGPLMKTLPIAVLALMARAVMDER